MLAFLVSLRKNQCQQITTNVCLICVSDWMLNTHLLSLHFAHLLKSFNFQIYHEYLANYSIVSGLFLFVAKSLTCHTFHFYPGQEKGFFATAEAQEV